MPKDYEPEFEARDGEPVVELTVSHDHPDGPLQFGMLVRARARLSNDRLGPERTYRFLRYHDGKPVAAAVRATDDGPAVYIADIVPLTPENEDDYR